MSFEWATTRSCSSLSVSISLREAVRCSDFTIVFLDEGVRGKEGGDNFSAVLFACFVCVMF